MKPITKTAVVCACIAIASAVSLNSCQRKSAPTEKPSPSIVSVDVPNSRSAPPSAEESVQPAPTHGIYTDQIGADAEAGNATSYTVTTRAANGSAGYYANTKKDNANTYTWTPTDEEKTKQGTFNTEDYKYISENEFIRPAEQPLSTFSIDVDVASYGMMRKKIEQGQAVPKDAVRIEELVNYFTYKYPEPKTDQPFSVNTELSYCPWNPEHKLLRVGIHGKKIETQNLPAANLVFLVDVSGSMDESDKLPLVKNSLRMLVNQLNEKDKVAIVTYAGASGVALPSTSCNNKEKILQAIEDMSPGGSTNGAEGIHLAYKIARDNMVSGNNRVILCTDGDFNVGVSSDGELVRIIEKKRTEGIFLSVLGYGMGNYKDSKMEQLADKGNGNYAYIDNLFEAKKNLVSQMGGTLLCIAKDVKIQVEFNPQKVKGYRLIGYENRLLNAQDFNDDTKDAGEIGAGTNVTAFYEITMSDNDPSLTQPKTDPLKYQNNTSSSSNDLLTVKLRYKEPKEDKSKLIEMPVPDKAVDFGSASEDFRFAASVASFGMVLRDSKFKGSSSISKVTEWARNSKGADTEGYRSEFIRLAELAKASTSMK